MLAFTSVYFFELRLFNGLRAIQTKNLLKLVQADFERQGQFLKNILPAARNRGTIWMIVYPNDRNHHAPVSVGYSAAPGPRTGPDLFVGEHSGHIYARDGVVTPREWIRIGGDFRSMSIARTRQFEPVSSRPHLSIIGLTSAGGVFASGRWPDGVRDIFSDKDFKLSEMVPYCLDLQLDSMPVKEDAQFLDRLYFVSLVPHEQTVQPSLAENWWRCTSRWSTVKGNLNS